MASYFQSYFQASSMPKRLLQYALSRLDIFDTDTFDLDSLDIAWGKKCVFEFKDVGLRLMKLESLLQLPPSFVPVKARVLLLRLTIPVDIYSSPIVVEVDGVECQLRVKDKNGPSTQQATYGRNQNEVKPTSPSPFKPKYGAHNSSVDSECKSNGGDSTLPTVVDLAESFLQTEPEEDKVELEAAILSESPELSNSYSSIGDGENDVPLGTGTSLSLPAFMARFLTGIVNRLQVRIHGVTLGLDIGIPCEASRSPPSSTLDPVTIQLKVDDIDIEGVTHDLEQTPAAGYSAIKFPFKKGKRLIRLHRIQGTLISEADIFTTNARSTSMSAPSTAHSDTFDGKTPLVRMSPDKRKVVPKSFGATSPGRLSSSSSSRLSSRYLSKGANSPPLPQSPAGASDYGRFDDAAEDEDAAGLSRSLGSLDIGIDSTLQRTGYFEQLGESQNIQSSEHEGENPIGSSHATGLWSDTSSEFPASIQLESDRDLVNAHPTTEETDSALRSAILPTRQHSRFSQGRVSQSQASLPDRSYSPLDNTAYEPLAPGVIRQTTNTTQIGDEHVDLTLGEDDLAQSKIFSHEDAESMYMSAVSYGPLSDSVPERWARSSIGGNSTLSEVDAAALEMKPDSSEHGNHTTTAQTPPDIPTIDKHFGFMSPANENSILDGSDLRKPAPQATSNLSEHSATFSYENNKIAKTIFSIDSVAIYLPASTSEQPLTPQLATLHNMVPSSSFHMQNDASDSTSMNIPGAFSTQLPARHAQTPPLAPTSEPEPQKIENADNTIEVEVGRAAIQVDVSVGMVIWMLAGKLKEALGSEFSSTSRKEEPKESSPLASDRDLKFKAEQISILFMEKVEGNPILTPLSDNLSGTHHPVADILLRTTVDGLCISSHFSNARSETAVTIKKFAFGYATDHILSFDANLQMRASVRDLEASAGIDVSIDICKTAESSRVDIKTLPLHVSIDLQKLDETFSWFGGLSSVLNLGSSIASNTTITATSPNKQKSHGVRFEVPISPDDKSLPSQNKTDIRIGGFILDLIGTDCSVGIETSAVKVVSRDEGVGAVIQKIRLSGPHLKDSINDPAIDVEVTATRVEYLPSPKDVDLDALLSLITPSKAKYDQDDDILLETLLRQRKQGAVLRISVQGFQSRMGKLDRLVILPGLVEEISRLSTVAKYLPDDDRPGLLCLVTLNKIDAQVDVGHNFGTLQLTAQSIEIAQITFPALTAFSVNTISVRRNGTEEILGIATDPELRESRFRAPAIMARMIGDEMEPIVKIKLWNLKFEYRVPTLIAVLDLAEKASTQDSSSNLTASITMLAGLARSTAFGLTLTEEKEVKKSNLATKPMTIDIVLRDCICGLNPLGLTSKLLVVLTEAHLSAVLPKDKECSAIAEMNKASLLVIDNVANISTGKRAGRSRRHSFDGGSSQVADLCGIGFVSVGYISSAKASARILTDEDGEQAINVEFRDDLFVVESCADSTQTLITVLNGLSPPSPPNKDLKYRTKVIPVKDLLASLSGDAFGTAEGDYNFDDDFDIPGGGDINGEELDDFDFDSRYYQHPEDPHGATLGGEATSSAFSHLTTKDTHDGVLLESFVERTGVPDDDSSLEFEENHFGAGSILDGNTYRWNSSKNTYDRSNTSKARKTPLKICIREVHIIWNLFDGYDWQHTRDAISKAVQDVESKAIENRARFERGPAFEQDIEDEETVIGDFLFNSIYIGIPANRDPRGLTDVINQELNDNTTETESVAVTSVSASPNRQGVSRARPQKLRLKRSKHHKITFELKGICADFVTFPPGSGETQSSIDIRVHDFEIFDHVPTSTWRKFATYMQDAGERETGTSMIHIEILNVKPVPDLAASEIVLKAAILPLRLHVDQDALDFITRFFEFKDDSALSHPPPGEAPFLQRVEVNSVQVKLDFKPKRVDYAGLRSGHTTEFMNFLILEEADMVLRHTIIYGISGFEKLGKTLNDIWMPEIKRNQLPGILAGLAPVRSIVNVGGGLRHLVLVPIREYQKDGRIVRSISKGATAFAKTTGTELVKLGAKVAIGVQTVLQGAEGMLSPAAETSRTRMGDDDDDEETKQISLYANQPVGVLQGIRGGYDGLQRDLILARDAIIAVPGEVMEDGNAAGVLRAVRKHAPTVILRPAIGVAKAGGQVLMGATNALDPTNLRRADAKYKRH